MGSGSTIAAAEALGLCAIGVERYLDYYEQSCVAVPKLASITVSSEKRLLQSSLWDE